MFSFTIRCRFRFSEQRLTQKPFFYSATISIVSGKVEQYHRMEKKARNLMMVLVEKPFIVGVAIQRAKEEIV